MTLTLVNVNIEGLCVLELNVCIVGFCDVNRVKDYFNWNSPSQLVLRNILFYGNQNCDKFISLLQLAAFHSPYSICSPGP